MSKNNTVPSLYRPQGGKFYNNPSTNDVVGIELMLIRRLQEMCINRFTWHGLPETIDARFVEKILFENGLIVYCRQDNLIDTGETDMMLRATPGGQVDYQDNPLTYYVWANNMFHAYLDADECVPIWSNTARMPDHDIVLYYARRLAEVERTIDINLKNARHSRVIAVPEEMRLTAANFNRQVDEGNPVIFVSDAMNMAAYSTFNVDMDEKIIQAVAVAKNQIMNDCLTALGINNANQDKVERLIAGEVDARSEQVGINRAIALSERERGAKAINKMFPGLNVTVTWNEEINKEVESEGVSDNGKLHDGTKESSGTDK